MFRTVTSFDSPFTPAWAGPRLLVDGAARPYRSNGPSRRTPGRATSRTPRRLHIMRARAPLPIEPFLSPFRSETPVWLRARAVNPLGGGGLVYMGRPDRVCSANSRPVDYSSEPVAHRVRVGAYSMFSRLLSIGAVVAVLMSVLVPGVGAQARRRPGQRHRRPFGSIPMELSPSKPTAYRFRPCSRRSNPCARSRFASMGKRRSIQFRWTCRTWPRRTRSEPC